MICKITPFQADRYMYPATPILYLLAPGLLYLIGRSLPKPKIMAAGMIAVMAVLLLTAPFVIRRLVIKRWENRVRQAGPTEGSIMIYRYLMKKLRYAGFTKPPEVTLFKYMKGQRRALKSFAVGSTDLFVLTRLYHKVLYGCRELEPSEFARFWKVYDAFRGNMKDRLGKVKYALRYFFI